VQQVSIFYIKYLDTFNVITLNCMILLNNKIQINSLGWTALKILMNTHYKTDNYVFERSTKKRLCMCACLCAFYVCVICWIGDLVNVHVKLSYCCLNHFVCVYMILLYGLHLTLALWTDWKHAKTSALNIFCYSRMHSVTNMLSELGLPTFVELLDKCRIPCTHCFISILYVHCACIVDLCT